jgi:hypothetical protein
MPDLNALRSIREHSEGTIRWSSLSAASHVQLGELSLIAHEISLLQPVVHLRDIITFQSQSRYD